MSDLAIIPRNGQSSLDDLAAKVRAARGLASEAVSRAVQHSIECGEALTLAKAKVKHGEWSRFLKQCKIGERQAQRYIQLAELAKSNPSLRTVLAGLPIQSAIQLLKKTATASELVRVSQTSTPASPDAGGKLNTLAWSNATFRWHQPSRPVRSTC
jgi:Protein of unknown function (DUF3102)